MEQSSPKTVITEGLNKQVYEHIRIYYAEEEDAFVDLTIEAMKQAEKRTSSVFQFEADRPLDVIYFDDKETIEQMAGIKHITGFYSDHDQMIGLYPDKREALLKKETLPLYFFNTLLFMSMLILFSMKRSIHMKYLQAFFRFGSTREQQSGRPMTC